MDKQAFLKLLEHLNLPAGEYVVTGGACLTIRGLRETDDLDLFITDRLYSELVGRGWQETAIGKRRPYLISEIKNIPIQAFSVWEGKGWQPRIDQYLAQPEFVEGIPLMPLSELYAWKKSIRREKDLRDLVLIDSYFSKKS